MQGSRPRTLFASVIIAVPLLVAAMTHERATDSFVGPPHITPVLRYADLTAPSPAELPEHSVVLTMEQDDTLDAVLTAGGLSRTESASLTRGFGESIDLRRLRPGHLVRFHYAPDGAVDSVQMKVIAWGDVFALRGPGGTFTASARPAPSRTLTSSMSATIDTSLYETLRAAGEEPQLVHQLVDIFQWDIDFFELQKGDWFSLVVEKKFAGADVTGYGPVLAARFVHDGTIYEAFRHETPDGRAGYYGRDGRPLRKQFLKAPLKFTRITSGFSKSRFHPMLHYFRPHHGVDYGAPIGTPVMTTADGVVTEVSRSPGEGNFVRIRHTSRIETSYLHLSRFARGLKRGTGVMQGDVIGYVGMTGLATGPHLDYRVRDGNKWLDPLKLKSITSDLIAGESRRRFRNDVASLLPRLSSEAQQVAQATSRRRALF